MPDIKVGEAGNTNIEEVTLLLFVRSGGGGGHRGSSCVVQRRMAGGDTRTMGKSCMRCKSAHCCSVYIKCDIDIQLVRVLRECDGVLGILTVCGCSLFVYVVTYRGTQFMA